MLILVVVPLAFQASWKLNRGMQGIEAKQEGTGLIQILLSGETNFSDQEMQTYHDHFWEVFSDQQLSRDETSLKFNEFGYRLMPLFQDSFRLTMLGLFLIFPFWSLLIIYWTEKNQRMEYGLVLGIMYFTALAYLFIMYRTYPLIHSVERAQNMVSYLRYAHSVSMPMLFLGLVLLAPVFQVTQLSNLKGFHAGFHSIIFGIVLLLLLVFETPHIKPFYTAASFENNPGNNAFRWRKDTDSITTQIRKTIGKAKLWIYLPIKDNGFLATALRYQMTPVRTVVNSDPKLLNKPASELAKIWDDHEYLWFPVKNMEYDELFQKLFGKINSRLLKIKKEEGQLYMKGVQVSN